MIGFFSIDNSSPVPDITMSEIYYYEYQASDLNHLQGLTHPVVWELRIQILMTVKETIEDSIGSATVVDRNTSSLLPY